MVCIAVDTLYLCPPAKSAVSIYNHEENQSTKSPWSLTPKTLATETETPNNQNLVNACGVFLPPTITGPELKETTISTTLQLSPKHLDRIPSNIIRRKILVQGKTN